MKKLALERETLRLLTDAEAQLVGGGYWKPRNPTQPPHVSRDTSCDTIAENGCVASDASYCFDC